MKRVTMADFPGAPPELIVVGDQALTPKEYAARRKDLDHRAARKRERRATDSEYRERINAVTREWAARHREKVRAYNREWMRRRRYGEPVRAFRVVASLHDLGCIGPTAETGCRCQKITLHEPAI